MAIRNQSLQGSRGSAHQEGCANLVVLFMVWLWVVLVAFGRVGTVMLLTLFEAQLPEWLSVIYPVVESILLALPLLPLSILWREPRYRAVYRTWLGTAVFVLLLLPVQLLKPYEAQTQALFHIFLSLIFAGLVLWIEPHNTKESAHQSPNSSRKTWVAILIAILFAYPWLSWGAFGSPLDTLLQLLAGLSFGIAVAALLSQYLIRPFLPNYRGHASDFWLGTFAAGTTLLIMASGLGFGYGSMQLLLMICLPPLGPAVMGFVLMNRARIENGSLGISSGSSQVWSLAVLVGLCSAAPMMLIDPVELSAIVSATPGEILQWGLYAAGISLLVAWISGLVILAWLSTNRRRPEISRRDLPFRESILFPGILIALVIGAVLYFAVGQPGFYGEGLFVILKDQKVVINEGPSIKDYIQRREYVYTALVQFADQTQADLRRNLDRFHIPYTPFYLENAIEVQGGPLLRLWLMTRPEVDRVLENPWMRPLPVTPSVTTGSASAPSGIEWNLQLIGADRVWNELHVTGKGIIVGQSDSGVQWDHPELKSSYRGWNPSTGKLSNDYNWFDPWAHTTVPNDIASHGTHTLGTILGQHTGVAPGATWFACANLKRNLGNPSLYLDCMQFMLAPFPLGGDPFKDGDPSRGAQVINNSWGCPNIEGCDPEALHPATQALQAAGVFVVASAGNDGPSCDTVKDPLPIYPEVFAVGAIDSSSNLAYFSSLGPVTVDGSSRIKPDIVAPGVDVLSSTPENTYARYPGTSMAGPHVVGVVALMWSANPALIGNIDQTEQILRQTATSYSGFLPSCPDSHSKPSSAVGYGIVNAYSAVKMALQEKTP